MKCIIMNKNKEVMLVEFNKLHNIIDKIYEIYDIKFAPLSIYNAFNNKKASLIKEVNNWFKGRGIPSWRKDIENLLNKLNLSSPEELLNKAHGLSLSDQYWLKEENSKLKWKDINFFTNDFEYEAYLEASLDSSSNKKLKKEILNSPNNTTDGMLQKGWVIKNGKRCLIKGTYFSSREEPINEWLASQISKRLGFNYCNYELMWDNKLKLVSVCENFITKDEEIISAYDIYNSKRKNNNINDYEFYLSLLEEHNVTNAREDLENMFITDYIVMNFDRHLKNFGIIRNVNTLKWKKITPIFDTGEAMECNKLTEEINFNKGYGKFFSNSNKEFDSILKTLGKNIERIDLTNLEGISNEYYNILKQYQDKLDISDIRINKLVNGLNKRINKLNNYINKLKAE